MKVVSSIALYFKLCWCSVTHATGLSQWLMTKQMSAEFIRREFSTPSKDEAQRTRQQLWAKAHSVVAKKRSPSLTDNQFCFLHYQAKLDVECGVMDAKFVSEGEATAEKNFV
ncbi:MAG: hypothetical protein N3B10_03575 [Armatimonadetes bacterium]|nr:hypothetical protein [Armatimonadota bacterium]